MRRGRPRHRDILTPREWQVLELLEQDRTNEQIARELGISFDTAKFHVSEILTKLGLTSRQEAAQWRAATLAEPSRKSWLRIPPLVTLVKGSAAFTAAGAIAVLGLIVLGVILMNNRSDAESPLGKVAFIRDRDVWVKYLPDGKEEQVTRWGDVYADPDWSPSGDWLLVTRGFPGLRKWVVDASGNRGREMQGFVMWAPLKDELLVFSDWDQPPELRIESADGRKKQTLAVDGHQAGYPLGWSPDGQWIVLSMRSQWPSTREVMILMRPDGSDAREFIVSESFPGRTINGAEWPNTHMGWSPDSRYVISAYQRPSQLIELVAIDTEGFNTLIAGPTILFEPLNIAYSDSGETAVIAASSRRDVPSWRLVIYDPGSGRTEDLGLSWTANPAWAPNGSRIFYAAPDAQLTSEPDEPARNFRIWVVGRDGSNPRQLTSDSRYQDEYPLASRDGVILLFIRQDHESETGTTSLWMLNLATRETTMVADQLNRGAVMPVGGPYPDNWSRFVDWWMPTAD